MANFFQRGAQFTKRRVELTELLFANRSQLIKLFQIRIKIRDGFDVELARRGFEILVEVLRRQFAFRNGRRARLCSALALVSLLFVADSARLFVLKIPVSALCERCTPHNFI